MKNAVIYIHGKDGNSNEADHYKKFLNDEYRIIGFEYKLQLPWEAEAEFQKYFADIASKYNEIVLIGNSIGAYFSLISLSENFIKKAMFISPIVDMENLILNMMKRAGGSEEELKLKKVISTPFGELLSWDVPSSILYGKNDVITPFKIISDFANKINADLTVMENSEHWFHTREQMIFLDNWFKKFI